MNAQSKLESSEIVDSSFGCFGFQVFVTSYITPPPKSLQPTTTGDWGASESRHGRNVRTTARAVRAIHVQRGHGGEANSVLVGRRKSPSCPVPDDAHARQSVSVGRADQPFGHPCQRDARRSAAVL